MIISALYTLVKKWYDEGMPVGTIPFTSFPNWAKICGGIMECARYGNPCELDKTAIMSLDYDTEIMKQLFESCYEKNPNKWMTKGDIQRIIENENIMPELDFNNRADQTKFGIKIDKYVNRIMSGIFMKVDSLEQRAARRKYIFIKDENHKIDGKITENHKTDEKIIKNFSENHKTDEKTIENFCENQEKVRTIIEKKEKVRTIYENNKTDIKNAEKCLNFLKPIFDENHKIDEKTGNLGNNGKVLPSVHIEKLNNIYRTEGKTRENTQEILLNIPIVGRGVNVATVTQVATKNPQKSLDLLKNESENYKKDDDIINEVSKKYDDLLKKKNEQPQKEKTDRELQFYESPECESIKAQTSKEQVLGWLKEHPGIDFKQMDKDLGLGCLKFIVELYNENLIETLGEGWKVK